MGFSMFYQDGIGIMGKSMEQSAHPYEYGLRNPLNVVIYCAVTLWVKLFVV